jgi:hypothetical protein
MMRRLLDLTVVLVLIATAVYTVRSLREGAEAEPNPENERSEAATPARELASPPRR